MLLLNEVNQVKVRKQLINVLSHHQVIRSDNSHFFFTIKKTTKWSNTQNNQLPQLFEQHAVINDLNAVHASHAHNFPHRAPVTAADYTFYRL